MYSDQQSSSVSDKHKMLTSKILNQLFFHCPATYPLVGDDLVGSLLQLVQTQSPDGGRSLQGLGLLIGCGGTPCGTSGGDVIEVQVLVAGQVFLL